MNETKEILRRGDKMYEWDDVLGGWVRAHHLDEHTFNREDVTKKSAPPPSNTGPKYFIQHTTPSRAQRRAAAATTRGRHYNPDVGKMVPGKRTIAKKEARRKMREHREFLSAVRDEKKKKQEGL